MGFKIGICGAGRFSKSFIPLFKAHPLVDEVVLADLLPERLQKMAREFDIDRTFGSLDELCESDVHAIAIMTQRHLHGEQALQSLKAGKHVYSAVPIGQTVDEIRSIINFVEKTDQIYMMGETCYYFPSAIYCRNRFRKGDFGNIFYSEGQYLHDMSDFYEPYKFSGGKDWKKVAGIPPMYYSTHSVSMILSVTGAYSTSVSCLGYKDNHEDGIFKADANLWNNVFSNETALMRTSDGGIMRINEFRRVGWKSSRQVGTSSSIYGTKGCFEAHANSQIWTTIDPKEMTDLNDLLSCRYKLVQDIDSPKLKNLPQEFPSGVSNVHPIERLPREFIDLPNGHLGSHQFLVDDFCKAVIAGALPPNHAWDAAKYCIPGLIAHQSALCDGKLMNIPDFGDPPEHWQHLDPQADIIYKSLS